MSTEQQIQEAFEATMAMYEAKVFSDLDRQQASPSAMRDFRALLRKRLLNGGPPPTVDEVEGIKEMALDILNYTPGRPPSPYRF